MTVAFVCAMPMELRPLTKKLSLRSVGGGLHEGTIGGRPVVAVVTGMGTALATTGTERLLDAVDVDRVVVVGITGALEDGTPIGTIVRPEVVVDSATGDEFRPAPLGATPPAGKMWTTDTITTDPGTLRALMEDGVVSLDMETAAIARVCERRSVPWSVVRVISDRASDGTVDEEVFRLSRQDGTPNPRAVMRYVVSHPGRIPGMARMGRNARLATHIAADEAIRLVAGGVPG